MNNAAFMTPFYPHSYLKIIIFLKKAGFSCLAAGERSSLVLSVLHPEP